MKRPTKDQLNQKKIFNPHNLATNAGTLIYIEYIPADNGRLTSRYAYWILRNLRDHKKIEVAVTGRFEKPVVLQKIMAWAKQKYDIIEWEKDPFGAYQVKGAMEKVMQ